MNHDTKQSSTLVMLWSGGFDSTALLLHSLSSTYEKILVVTAKLGNAANVEEDARARHDILEYLRINDNRIEKRYTFMNSTLDLALNGGIQSMVWAMLASMATERYENFDLQMGFIRGDDYWHYKTEFETAVRNLCSINDKTPHFVYPLEWMYKKEFVWMYAQHPRVFDMISWAGDTQEIKLKEKEDLQLIMQQINHGCTHRQTEVIPPGGVEKQKSVETDDMYRLANQSKL